MPVNAEFEIPVGMERCFPFFLERTQANDDYSNQPASVQSLETPFPWRNIDTVGSSQLENFRFARGGISISELLDKALVLEEPSIFTETSINVERNGNWKNKNWSTLRNKHHNKVQQFGVAYFFENPSLDQTILPVTGIQKIKKATFPQG